MTHSKLSQELDTAYRAVLLARITLHNLDCNAKIPVKKSRALGKLTSDALTALSAAMAAAK